MGNFDEYFPFDPGYGASANTARWRKMAQLWQSDGVIKGYLGELNASWNVVGTSLTVATGGIFIHGYYAEIINPQNIGVASGGTVVAQVSFINETAQIYFKATATDYGPSATLNFEQSPNNWEIPLWLISGNNFIDLRTMINPGMGLSWWAWYNSGASITVPTNSVNTTAAAFLTARIPHAAPALLTGNALVTFPNLSAAQSAICSLVYQNGAADQYPPAASPSAAITPGIGAGGTAASIALPVSVSMLVPAVTQGRKTAGWIVSAGTGASIQISQLTLSMSLVGTPTLN